MFIYEAARIIVIMKPLTEEIIEALSRGEEVSLFLIQNSWVRGGIEGVSLNVASAEKPDLVISPTYYEKFMAAHTLDEELSFEEIEQDIEMLAKTMRQMYSKMIGGSLQLWLL